MIRFYQRWVSPAIPPRCRFQPTCSSYSVEAIQRFGVISGLWLALKRVCRCHPWHEAAYDPCPEPTKSGPLDLERN